MSAIWGQVSWNEEIAGEVAQTMRLPYEQKCKLDKIREYRQKHFYMGCGIQFVTKESVMEQLPIIDRERNCSVTIDGLLDNRQELINLLQVTDDTLPDGSLMYQAYCKWGMDCLTHFRGLFSMAVYEFSTRKLYLAVDQVSARCLYYYVKNGKVSFSTLLAPILAAHPEITVNEMYLKDFVTAPGLMPNIVSTETPYKDVYKLNPGTWVVISESDVQEHYYWKLEDTDRPVVYKKAKDYGNYFRALYEDCVNDALRTAGNVGIAMSSGLDSASVGALAAKHLAQNQQTLYAYTYVPYENGIAVHQKNFVLDEKKDVLAIAQMHPNIKTHFLNNQGKNCYEEIDACMETMEIPFKAFVNFPNLRELYREAYGDGCRVMLSGQTGNASVSHGYIDDVLYDLYSHGKYVTFLKNLNHYSKTVKESRKAALRGCIRYFHHAEKVYSESELDYDPDNPFMNRALLDEYPLHKRYREGGITVLDQVPLPQKEHRAFLRKKAVYTYMGEYETKLGLEAGIVIRDPTKDIRMLQFVYHLPYELFAHDGIPRWLIRENLRDVLPARLLDDWMRYGVQNADWLQRIRRDWDDVSQEILEDIRQDTLTPYIDRSAAEGFIREVPDLSKEESDSKLQYLMYLCVLGRFLRLDN